MGPKKNKTKEEKKKKTKEPKNSRRWTDTELNTYADVLADPENCFAATLDKLALKKSSNNEVFEHIQKHFVSEIDAMQCIPFVIIATYHNQLTHLQFTLYSNVLNILSVSVFILMI